MLNKVPHLLMVIGIKKKINSLFEIPIDFMKYKHNNYAAAILLNYYVVKRIIIERDA